MIYKKKDILLKLDKDIGVQLVRSDKMSRKGEKRSCTLPGGGKEKPLGSFVLA